MSFILSSSYIKFELYQECLCLPVGSVKSDMLWRKFYSQLLGWREIHSTGIIHDVICLHWIYSRLDRNIPWFIEPNSVLHSKTSIFQHFTVPVQAISNFSTNTMVIYVVTFDYYGTSGIDMDSKSSSRKRKKLWYVFHCP